MLLQHRAISLMANPEHENLSVMGSFVALNVLKYCPTSEGLMPTLLQCCRDFMNECESMRGGGVGPLHHYDLPRERSQAVIEYRTNASIYYLKTLHYH